MRYLSISSIRAKAAADQLTQKMKSREELLDELTKTVTQKLSEVSNDASAYEAHIVKLIVQACIKLQETNISIACREVDQDIVKRALPKAEAEFNAFMSSNAANVPDLNLTLSSQFLPPPPTESEHGLTCAGGIVASAKHGRIKCDNTFDRRMEQAFEALKPQVRRHLFPSQIATEIQHGSAMGGAHAEE